MTYSYDEKKKAIKDFAKKNNLKVSVRKNSTGYHPVMEVCLLAGEQEIFAGAKYSDFDFSDLGTRYETFAQYLCDYGQHLLVLENREDEDVIQAHYNKCLTPYGFKMLWEISKLMLQDRWVDFDPLTDYYDTNCYLTLNGGRWDREYTVVKK